MGKRLKSALIAVIVAIFAVSSNVLATADIDGATNQQRAEYGLPPLSTWAVLQSVANLRLSESMVTFAHPSDWQYLFNMLPGCVTMLGENLAYYTTGAEPAGWPVSYTDPKTGLPAGWMASPGHRANILGDWDWQLSAIGYSGTRTYAVQLFAKGCTTPTPPAPPAPGTGPAPVPIVEVLPDTAMDH